MNEIRLSGVLQAVVERNSKGGTFLTATLKFDREGRNILVIAAGPAIRELQPFDSGDPVRIIGRLTTFKDNFVVLVSECSRWAIASENRFPHDRSKADRTLREVYFGDASKGWR